MNCLNKEENRTVCPCTYISCLNRGMCCSCVQYHRSKNEIPGCFFPADAEKTYNRSLEFFVSLFKNT